MNSIDRDTIREMLRHKSYMREMISACSSCGLCAESCFFYKNTGDARAVPSYKVRKTLGRLFKTGGKVSRAELEDMAGLLWGHCALCRQCYCPMGIDLSSMMAWGRAICRSQNIDGVVKSEE
ncbi:MAG TPA: 4Fe-4S dicluster domain-containing protein [Spirochaetota bacterium]|nr:4Fe-4S dicluster domain-containing protein [Spirochaetota bacterium]HPJ35854.1 4Fe-4S dicluster domain-containing protein [Spirochaetota bacterium]